MQGTAIPPRGPEPQAIPGRGDPSSNYWQKVDDLFYDTMKRAQTGFRANLAINIIIVLIGLALIGVSIYSSLTKGTDLSSATFAGLGIADVVTTFFLNPQKGIQKSLNNLVSIQALYRTYLVQLENLTDLERQLEESKKLTTDDVEKINNDISQITTDATAKIKALAEETK